MSNLITDLLNNKNRTIPIWLMRQAGRYMSEYMKIRNEFSNFLEFCYDSEQVKEITLQPINKFGFDAAIIFSDILVIPHFMGIKVEFEKGHGPKLESITNIEDLKKISKNEKKHLSENVYQSITKVRKELPPEKALIGFAGSAWTLASYIVEGKITKDLSIIKNIYYNDPKFIDSLIDILVEEISKHLINQANSGADILKLFDSWAGFVSDQEYDYLVIKPTQKIISNVRKFHPNIPIMCFPRMSGVKYEYFCDNIDCDIVTIDQYMDLGWIKKRSNGKILQGNLDPSILTTNSKDLIKTKVENILNLMDGDKFIFNLGHGVLPTTNPENVSYLVNLIKEKRC